MMGTMEPNPSFYEDDESLEDVTRAYERGEKGVTRRPVRGRTEYLRIGQVGSAGFVIQETNTPSGSVVSRKG